MQPVAFAVRGDSGSRLRPQSDDVSPQRGDGDSGLPSVRTFEQARNLYGGDEQDSQDRRLHQNRGTASPGSRSSTPCH